jgi:hypothetical protein
MKGVDTLGLVPHFDGTGYPRWKVLMEAYLQAKDLDIWRVTDEGMCRMDLPGPTTSVGTRTDY